MKFTEKQFEKIGEMYMDDLPFHPQGLKFFNSLPVFLQGEILQYGSDDTVVREKLFKFIVDNQFGMTIKEYYGSTIFSNSQNKIPINYSRLRPDEDNDIIIFENEYNGFESFFNFSKDMDVVFSFDKAKMPLEFSGKIKVKIEYYPSIDDLEQLKKM